MRQRMKEKDGMTEFRIKKKNRKNVSRAMIDEIEISGSGKFPAFNIIHFSHPKIC